MSKENQTLPEEIFLRAFAESNNLALVAKPDVNSEEVIPDFHGSLVAPSLILTKQGENYAEIKDA